MPYVEDRGGLDLGGKDPWEGYPAAIVERVLRVCDVYNGNPAWSKGRIGPGTRFFPSPEGHPRATDPRFLDDLGFVSMESVEIVIAIEEEFSIEIADEDAEAIVTVGHLVQYVKDRIG